MTRPSMMPFSSQPSGKLFCRASALVLVAAALASCNGISYTQRQSPANPYKDFKEKNQSNASVLGMGEPISSRQMTANATLSLNGQYTLAEVMQRVAGTYNTAIRWGNGARREKRENVTINKLTFDEARNYIEDVYDIQIIKEGERRLLILPSASEPRLTAFNPGNNVSLSQALRGLAEQCNYNLVINENREQINSIRVTANLKNVTCYDAFEALLNPHGLSIINAGDYMTVGGLPQRQWTLNLYEPQRTETVEVNYSSDFSAATGGGTGSSSGGGSSESSSGAQSAGGSTKVSVKYDRNLWKDLQEDLDELVKSNCIRPLDAGVVQPATASLLPPPDGSTPDPSLVPPQDPSMAGVGGSSTGSSSSGMTDDASAAAQCGYVRINSAVGLIQMRAPRAVLDEADEIIQRVQDIASRRLLLEARVLAVSRNRNFNQQANLKVGSNKLNTGAGFSGSVTAALNNMLPTFTATDMTTVGGIAVKSGSLDAVIALLEQYGTTYELMHPMMELMDRQRATLIDGRNEKYYVVTTDTTTDSGTTTSTSEVEERSQFLGLQFSATAQVSDSPEEPHTISLQIPITSLAKTIDIPNGDGTTAGVAPVANTRLIDQKVRIRDNEIKVIGGLTKTIAIDTESGVPLIRDIPALGKLANEEAIQYENVEFVILLQVRRLY
ncbi:MAG: hypothetical protein DI628_08560 [Blastochloris viridis]|uniref:Uncharacterized protein n=1 Tax=Blastochloris viridis TaxID=1079 RepID=A0A6N4RA43_BLAVI|nr:MAG: hypothetical protein DI628_08560 [Blastochloris viridis]